MTSLLNIAGNIPVSAASEQGQSLRFEDGDSAYLSRTPASSGNRKTWTWSGWVKRGNLNANVVGNIPTLFAAQDSSSGLYNVIEFLNNIGNDVIYAQLCSASAAYALETSQVFRDVAGWYHIVWSVDTTQATASNRAKLYVNGEQVTSFSTAQYPPQNTDTDINYTVEHNIGKFPDYTRYFDGYLANVTLIDGQQLDPTSFGEYDGTLWRPKSDADITGNLTFGTNGFYLPFKQTTEAEGFSTVTYTGSGAVQSIEGVGFEPDMIWTKERTSTSYHEIHDSVRGVNKQIFPNATDAEESLTKLTSFDASGFSLAAHNSINESGQNYVAWCWDAGSGSAVSNTDGSITSTVKANTAKGFSVVSYTSNASGQDTVGHGLTSAPEMIITKSRDGGTFNWSVYHASVCDTTSKYLSINNTNALSAYSTIWGAALPTSSVFGITSGGGVEASDACIAYCFHSVSGYSSIGSYSGTGAAGNSITGLGFKPAWLMIKRTDSTSSWSIHDSTRNVNDPRNTSLWADTSTSEGTSTNYNIDFDSDGFTLNTSNAARNASGGTYIYMAIADTRDATFFGDTSGNGNNWTPNALNNTDVVPDSPVTGGNFCTWNPLQPTGAGAGVMTLSEGNLKATGGSSIYRQVMGNISVKSGKWYTETYISDAGFPSWMIGWTYGKRYEAFTADATYLASMGYFTGSTVYFSSFGTGYASTTVAYSGLWSGARAPTTGDVIGCAIDFDNGNVWWSINGEWVDVGSGAGDPANGTNPSQTFTASTYADEDKSPHYLNYNGSAILNAGQDSSFAGNITAGGNTDDNGQGDFKYSVPSGFLCLKTSNLDTPAITAPDEYFNTVLYTGNGSTQSISVGWQPDWTWIKRRDAVTSNNVYDSVRGATERLRTNLTNAEDTKTDGLTSFDTSGFSLGSANGHNGSGGSFVAWNWLASNSTVSNTDGSITSTVSANQTAGFSVVSYTGTGANATVGHGLSSAPEMIITKWRTGGTAQGWPVYHSSIGNTKYLALNLTDAESANSTLWNNTSPTSTNFSIGTNTWVNGSSWTYISYCFHSVEGYSKVGSYTGNGSTDGTFVHCGFRPAFVMVKRTDSTNSWPMFDNQREGYNVDNDYVYANLTNAEGTADLLDLTSNGFKIRSTSAAVNTSGGSYIFLAFAEAPFKSANAR